MPHKNVIREFLPDRSYHVYNRGVERRLIFLDEQDHYVFLKRLELMLCDREGMDRKDLPLQPVKSFYGEVELQAFCLMPNHFHLLLHQNSDTGVAEFMRTLSTSYTMYFNKRYERDGSLFQGRYKARLVNNDAYRLHISRYIHLNPLALGRDIERYEYSSLRYYSTQDMAWLNTERVLEDFGSYEKYRDFVLDYATPNQLQNLEENYKLT